MSIREAINRNPKRVATVVAVAIVACIGVMLVQLMASDRGRGNEQSLSPKAWYTVDDGRTWFAGPGNKVVPFEHEGKQAYRCYVWTFDGGKTRFVSHLERLKPAVRARYGPQAEVEPWNLPPGAEQIKPPLTGDTGWIPEDSPQAAQIMIPRSPDGKGNLEAVVPR